MDGPLAAKFRALPQVQRLLETAQAQDLVTRFHRPAVLAALRTALDEARISLHAEGGVPPDDVALLHQAAAMLTARPPRLVPVINATGIILHTNLGRAPLAAEAIAAVAAVASGYCNLEYDLIRGERGSRTQSVEALLQRLTGAASGLVVNNCAAAMLLALSALAAGGEVIVSRGELVEIGGGFRIPDVIQQGGARLVEVGTTNKTRAADYRAAITPATRVLLKVHRSNFRITGFTEEVALPELATLAGAHGLLVVHDLGSGTLVDLPLPGQPPEMTVQQSVAAGSDVVTFSGDKLLGGPQSGLLVGQADAIGAMHRHPLLRALRLDKMTLAALEATLHLHERGAAAAIPVLRQFHQDAAVLHARAQALADRLGPIARVQPTLGRAGGGTLPGAAIPSFGVRLHAPAMDAETLTVRLRHARPAVIGRITDGNLMLDMLTVADAELPALVAAIQAAVAG